MRLLLFRRRPKIGTPFEMAVATDRPVDRPIWIHERAQVDGRYKYPAARIPGDGFAIFFILEWLTGLPLMLYCFTLHQSSVVYWRCGLE